MIVKCLKIINERTQQEHDMSSWLTVGKEYTVLMMEIYPTKNYFLLIDDSTNKAPGLHDTKQFEVVTHHIPSNWQIKSDGLEIMAIGPKSWQEPDFWERCYEGDESSLEVYKHETRVIMEEEDRS